MTRRILLALACVAADARAGQTIRVPADRPTIQAAYDAAGDGDTVLLDPGVYREKLKLGGKGVTVASRFVTSNDRADVASTVLDGAAADKPNQRGTGPTVAVAKGGGPGPKLVGLTIRNADHAVVVTGRAEVLHCHFTANGDALSFEDGQGVVRHSVFHDNADDGVDMDGGSQAVIEDNVFRDNKDDGIEIRLHKYAGPPLETVIRRNVFSGNKEDGLQLIDYPGKTPRTIRVERNVFANNAMAGIGSMEDGDTKENYAGAELREPVFIVNNTFVGNRVGLTGGNNMVVLNNAFVGHAAAAIRKVHGDSAAGPNLFWQNGATLQECDLNAARFVEADPLLDAEHKPKASSPAIDGGAAEFKYNGETLTIPAEGYEGAGPDLGAGER